MNAFDLMNKLSVIYDARQQWKVDHKLSDILLLTICAVIAGCEGWEEIEDFGNERLDWLRNYGEFEYGIPSHHTFQEWFQLLIQSNFKHASLNGCRPVIRQPMEKSLQLMVKRQEGLTIKARKKVQFTW